MVQIPEFVRQKALARRANAWLDDLDLTLRRIERAWDVRIGATLHGGSETYVAGVRTGAGTEAVLKVAMPDAPGLDREIAVLQAADGRGYARLLEVDLQHGIMLQERLGPSLRELNLPVAERLRRICAALQRSWAVPAPAGLVSGGDKAGWLAEFIGPTWRELDRPCPAAVIDRALGYAATRAAAFDPDSSVLVHGDAHDANALQDPAAPGEVRFVDPDGMFADRAYDLGILMREFNAELLAGDARALCRSRCAFLAGLTGVDPVSIWEWGFIERVSTGLFAMQVGATQMGRDMLDVAEALVC